MSGRRKAQCVLVLDGHTNQALACVRSLARAGHTVLVASHRRSPLAAWSEYSAGSFRLPGETVSAFAAMRAWARERNVTTVLPLTERASVLCNAERGVWEALGIAVGCAPEEILAGAFDKALTLQHAAACGISIPPTRFPGSLAEFHVAAEEIGFPCVVKSRFSNAWDGQTFLQDGGASYVNDTGSLASAVAAHRQGACWPIIQGFVPGQGKGVFALCDEGRVVAWFAHERLRDVRPSGSGSSLRRSVALEPRLRRPAERLLSELRWHGPAMVEFRDDGVSAPMLMEVNGRFWGSLQLAVEAGADFPRMWIDILSGRSVASGEYTEGVTLRWLWGDVKRFLYILTGPPAGYPGTYPTIWEGIGELLGPQPAGTRLEAWHRRDPWPAIGEWVQGISELIGHALSARRGGRSAELREPRRYKRPALSRDDSRAVRDSSARMQEVEGKRPLIHVTLEQQGR